MDASPGHYCILCFDSWTQICFAAWLFFLKLPGHVAAEFPFFWKEDFGPAAHESLIWDALGMSPSSRFSLGCESFGQCCPHPACQYFKVDIVGSSHLALINFNFTVEWVVSALQHASSFLFDILLAVEYLLWPPAITNKSVCFGYFPASHWAFMRF